MQNGSQSERLRGGREDDGGRAEDLNNSALWEETSQNHTINDGRLQHYTVHVVTPIRKRMCLVNKAILHPGVHVHVISR